MKPKSTSPTTRAGADGAPRLALAEFLPYRLNVVAAVASEGLARTYGERFGIGVPEWRVLATVGEFGSVTAKAIGFHAHMGKVKVSRAAAALEARGLLCRRPNPEDGREAFLVLTPDGREMYEEVVPLALAYEARLKAALSRNEWDALNAIIDKLLACSRSSRLQGRN